MQSPIESKDNEVMELFRAGKSLMAIAGELSFSTSGLRSYMNKHHKKEYNETQEKRWGKPRKRQPREAGYLPIGERAQCTNLDSCDCSVCRKRGQDPQLGEQERYIIFKTRGLGAR
jgi:hypothetical protein